MIIGLHTYYIIRNRLLFLFQGVIYGKNMRIYNRIYFKKAKSAKITIGDNFVFTSGCGFNPISSNKKGVLRSDANSRIVIGNNCGMSSTIIWAGEDISIGSNVLIGGDCLIMDSDRHSLDYRIRNGSIRDECGRKIDTQSAVTDPIRIEDDVLIGARVTILKGVTIGARSIIGAGSVVTRDIPSDVIAAGNPCKVIKTL